MEIKYGKDYLLELYVSGECSDKKHRFQPQVIKNINNVWILSLPHQEKKNCFL